MAGGGPPFFRKLKIWNSSVLRKQKIYVFEGKAVKELAAFRIADGEFFDMERVCCFKVFVFFYIAIKTFFSANFYEIRKFICVRDTADTAEGASL